MDKQKEYTGQLNAVDHYEDKSVFWFKGGAVFEVGHGANGEQIKKIKPGERIRIDFQEGKLYNIT